MSKFNFKNILIGSVVALVLAATVSIITPKVSASFPATHTDFTMPVNEGFSQLITADAVSENLSNSGLYTVTYKFSLDTYRQSNTPKDVSFSLHALLHNCTEGNGNDRNLYCWETNFTDDTRTVTLNAGNNYTQTLTYTIQQQPAQACGAFQSDLYAPNPTIYDGDPNMRIASIYRTGVTCPAVVPSPSPVPSPSVKPSVAPSPSPSASTIQCPTGYIQQVQNSTIVCVSQNQNQNQNQTQNNNQNQTVNQNVTATGGNSSSSSSSSSSVNVTVNNPASPAPSASPAVVTVVSQVKGTTTTLPKTGLPLAGLLLGGLLPGGLSLKRFAKKSSDMTANSIWMERQNA